MSEPGSLSRTTGPVTAWREYRFVLIFGIIALAITSIPYVVGATMATEERVFGGFVYATSDCYSYLAKMRQGAEGAWLFHLPYTPEPHPGTPFFLLHLMLGKIAALLPGGNLTSRMVCVYHAARWFFGLGLLMMIYRFLALLTGQIRVRRLAWLMTTFGGGLGWILIALGRPTWLGSLPLDVILPEGFTFLVLYAFPHIALARTFLLGGFLALLGVWRTGTTNGERAQSATRGWRSGTALAGLAWLAMGLVVPFYVAVAWAVTGAAWITLTLRRHRLCWQEIRAAVVAGLISSPAVIFSVWRFTTDTTYATWAAQNQILSPHPFHYVAAYGLPLALALSAARDSWKSDELTWLAWAWVAVVPILIYSPFNLQRRLVEGVQVPLSLLAAVGVVRITNTTSSAKPLRRTLVVGAILIALLPTNAMLVAGNTLSLRPRPHPVFRDQGEIAALCWLSPRVGPADVVLTSYETGNYLPARAGSRAFVGHGPETVHADEKRALVATFFKATTEDGWRQDLLEAYDIDYVFWGPLERTLGNFAPRTVPYLREVHRVGDYTIFTVEL